tara:strand:+ start:9217 stop:9879 length:663 start_codon:yes stop_codon:yes gene_type:complete
MVDHDITYRASRITGCQQCHLKIGIKQGKGVSQLKMLWAPLLLAASLMAAGAQAADYRTIEWIELMPADDLEAFLNPPESLNDIEDGTEADQIAGQLDNRSAVDVDDTRYKQALVSTRVIDAFDGQAIRVPGFIVPLEHDAQQRVTRFFLVPYYGACIHVPPPPPNQIIYAEYPKGFKLESLYEPFWMSGTMRTSLTENEMATSAYAMTVDRLDPYEDEE